jgi:hypothetical protein
MIRIPGRKARAAVLLALGMVLFAQLVDSEPVRKKMLDSLYISETDAVTTVRISLTTRVRYDSHFPYESGKELRIRITPFGISADDLNALFKRETLVPFDHEDLPLEEVVYEGDIEGGPYITLFFNRCVEFWVEQGRDSRSIVVYMDEVAPEVQQQPAVDPASE